MTRCGPSAAQAPAASALGASARSVAGAVLVLVTITPACGHGRTAPPIPGPSFRPTVPSLYWAVPVVAARRMATEVAGGDAAVKDAFDNPRTFLVLNDPAPEAWRGWSSARTFVFTDLGALRRALRQPDPLPFSAVAYSIEGASPPSQRTALAASVAAAGRLARARHLRYIVAPGVDLVATLDPRPRHLPDYYRDYLRLGVASTVAADPDVDVFVIQGQGLDDRPGLYRRFVSQAANQVETASPSLLVLAVIGTSPNGHLVTSDLLFSDVRATSSIVDGYWLTFGALVHCATCGNEEPREMVRPLDRVAGEGNHPTPH